MRSVAQMQVKNLVGSEPSYQAPSHRRQEVSEQVAKFVDRLFVRLKAIFPAWRTAFDSDETYQEAKRLWLEALVNNGITTVAQFKRGIVCAERSANPFMPSVGEFIAWCNSGNPYEHLNLPTAKTLLVRYEKYRSSCVEAEKFAWESAVEYHLVLQLQRAIYAENLNQEKALSKAKSLIDEMAKFLQEGNKVAPISTPKLAKKQGRELSYEERVERIQTIKAIFKGKRNG